MKRISQAIKKAELLLPGGPFQKNGTDPSDRLMAEMNGLIEENPREAWWFIKKWGSHSDEEIRTRVACFLLEHLLEYHFDRYFPLVRETCRKNELFASTFKMCWKFGQTNQPENSKAFDELLSELKLNNRKYLITYSTA